MPTPMRAILSSACGGADGVCGSMNASPKRVEKKWGCSRETPSEEPD